MALDLELARKPFRKLRKLLKNFPDPSSPDEVHDVRTHARKIEAIISAFGLDSTKDGGHLARVMKPIRRAAGTVRDMDVLTGLAVTLDPAEDGDSRLRLIEELAARREKAAAKMHQTVKKHEGPARDLLKACAKLAGDGNADDSRKARSKDVEQRREKSAGSMAAVLEIEQELRDWPPLTSKNLHRFRLKVKELRYVLQLSQAADLRPIEELGNLKDQIGLWHDWDELASIAKELDHRARCKMNAQISSRTREELKRALKSAHAFRARYLVANFPQRARRKGTVHALHPDLITATSRLAG